VHHYQARVIWHRESGAKFTDNRYSRAHEWVFDGGARVPGSSSPLSVPLPYSAAEAVDPEEALIASTSSCHMLWFLSLAAKRGFVVERYDDEAFGVMDKNEHGKLAFSRITLRPEIQFSGDKLPSEEDLETLHHAAHEECYIANSLRCEVVVESV
jgi:organic hydroperoxide reductase OsmC/OhrA